MSQEPTGAPYASACPCSGEKGKHTLKGQVRPNLRASAPATWDQTLPLIGRWQPLRRVEVPPHTQLKLQPLHLQPQPLPRWWLPAHPEARCGCVHSNPALPSKALGTQSVQGHSHIITALQEAVLTVSPKFTEAEKSQAKWKCTGTSLNKRAREDPWKSNETEINNLPYKEFKALVIQMSTELEERIYVYSERFNKELENIKNHKWWSQEQK